MPKLAIPSTACLHIALKFTNFSNSQIITVGLNARGLFLRPGFLCTWDVGIA